LGHRQAVVSDTPEAIVEAEEEDVGVGLFLDAAEGGENGVAEEDARRWGVDVGVAQDLGRELSVGIKQDQGSASVGEKERAIAELEELHAEVEVEVCALQEGEASAGIDVEDGLELAGWAERADPVRGLLGDEDAAVLGDAKGGGPPQRRDFFSRGRAREQCLAAVWARVVTSAVNRQQHEEEDGLQGEGACGHECSGLGFVVPSEVNLRECCGNIKALSSLCVHLLLLGQVRATDRPRGFRRVALKSMGVTAIVALSGLRMETVSSYH